MSAPGDDPGGGERPHSPSTPTRRKLKDRVNFYEQVWAGSPPADSAGPSRIINVDEFEKKLSEERRKLSTFELEHVALRHTPTGSPKHMVQRLQEVKPDGTFEETITKTTQEGDLASGVKTVKFETVTVRKTVRQMTSSSSATSIKKLTSRTPSEEGCLDSAYLTQSLASSLTSSEEILGPGKDSDQSSCGSSKVTSSGAEWYNEYRTQSFQPTPISTDKIQYVRSKSVFEKHIDEIKDNQERVQKKTFVNWINSYLSKVK
ncbi:unnamed protein product [Brassicogethes aeneus]|uniref:Uncharacterized protein n=1 Tax=Brassicogethes aeneus TaxID=1431903 RepID=A0A9P0FI10_BRAAE|nr:unnamed protein product [Brassicogethes aeneus]